MDKYEANLELEQIIREYLEAQGLDLVELICRYEGRDLFLRILTDKPEGGISLGECASLNREISLILDGKDILDQRYILEVSSPGLDRPLKNEKDFARCKNKNVKFFLNEMINGKLEWNGVINEVKNDTVFVDAGGNILEIAVSKINKAKRILDI